MIDYRMRSWVDVVRRVTGTVLPRIAGRVVISALIAAVAVYLKRVQQIDLSVPVLVHSLVGVALGLLLVFRTNASYDRYWEGRKLVGGMVNTTRDLARQTAAFFVDNDSVRHRATGYIIALYATIRRYLRDERTWSELATHLDAGELGELEQKRAAPLVAARWLTQLYAQQAAAGHLSEFRFQQLDRNLTRMLDLWGGAERIHKTPMPFAYAHHIKVFLALFCFTVPFVLINAMDWWAVGGTTIVAFGLFGIDEIGVEIEDPFGYDPNDLPLDAIGETIATDVAETLQAAPPV